MQMSGAEGQTYQDVTKKEREGNLVGHSTGIVVCALGEIGGYLDQFTHPKIRSLAIIFVW